MDTISNEKPKLQLQFWDGIKKAYVPQANAPVGRCRSWRRVLASKNWALNNPKHNPPRYAGYSRTQDEVQRAYLMWAQASGLKHVTAYSTRPPPNFAADRIEGYHKRKADRSVPLFAGTISYITLEQHFYVEQSTC